ncbi:MAG TPA: septum formation initiator family protein [Acidimicrobiales bacterium]|nr:septum formation initiator family protein [Acidimicrobiales bacterium]
MTRRTIVLLVAAGATLALLVLVVFPTRSYLHERSNLNSAAHQLQSLNAQNRQLSDQIGRLNSDAEIERLARKDYGLVKPGEEAYAILPGALAKAAAASKAPAAKPGSGNPPVHPAGNHGGHASPPSAPQAAPARPGLWDRFLDQLAFWR